jgi:hypothetical protein
VFDVVLVVTKLLPLDDLSTAVKVNLFSDYFVQCRNSHMEFQLQKNEVLYQSKITISTESHGTCFLLPGLSPPVCFALTNK